MNHDEFALVKSLIEQNEEMRVIAVGDDDQNIYEFRGASSKYLENFIREHHAIKYELLENYRSKNNLVAFSNQYVNRIPNRLKQLPIVAMQKDNGTLKIVRYQNKNLIDPLVQDILTTGLSGTTCVLTKTNDEALQITGLLLKNKVHAKLIQSNDGFNLYNLFEIRFFIDQVNIYDDAPTVSDEVWEHAKRMLFNRFRNSSNFEICKNIIQDFEATNTKKKYKSDLYAFIRESKLEDFFNKDGETIFVSTIHKAKGREFNNVFLLLEDFIPTTDEEKRQLYVAMTRAKNNLTIHHNTDVFDRKTTINLAWIDNYDVYSKPKNVAMQVSLKDVWLDYFINKQHNINELTSGDALYISENGCVNQNGKPILMFSKKLIEQLETKKAQRILLKNAVVNFIVYWKNDTMDHEVKIVLPELYFERLGDL